MTSFVLWQIEPQHTFGLYILERLQEKQGQVGSISTPARFQDPQSIEDMERIRK